MNADTWGKLMIVDKEDLHVLAEDIVALRLHEDEYVLAQPPIELIVMQAGVPGYLVATNLRGDKQCRTPYKRAAKGGEDEALSLGDAIRIRRLSLPVRRS